MKDCVCATRRRSEAITRGASRFYCGTCGKWVAAVDIEHTCDTDAAALRIERDSLQADLALAVRGIAALSLLANRIGPMREEGAPADPLGATIRAARSLAASSSWGTLTWSDVVAAFDAARRTGAR